MQENIRENNTGRNARKCEGIPGEDSEEGQGMGKE